MCQYFIDNFDFQGKIVGFYDSWPAGRRFAVDMAGFAVNIKLLHKHPNATIIYKAGYEEDTFLKDLIVSYDEIQPKAQNCTQVITSYSFNSKMKKTKKQNNLLYN